MEALYANTPLLTCRFGALEETAGPHSHYIDYAIVPNGLFPNIDPVAQADAFANMVVNAMNSSNDVTVLDEIKDLVGWEVVALEWKQHIYNRLKRYLSRGESQQALYTKSKYHKLFKRRFSTEEEWTAPALPVEKPIVVVSPFYNAADYIEKCIASVAAQNYSNYEHWLIDDASTDNGFEVASAYINQLPEYAKSKVKLVKNNENRGAVFNHVTALLDIDNGETIVMLLDGDDSLINRSDVFNYYNKIHNDHDFTYGSCWSIVDSIPLVAQEYPPAVRNSKSYKQHKFNWNMPYTHLRTLKAKLLMNELPAKFQDDEGNWFKAGGDNATFYTAIENCDPDRVYCVSDIVYNYNDASPINDYKVNRDEQDRAIAALTKPTVAQRKKRILIAVPTNKNIEAVTFKSIYDQVLPEGYEADFQFFWGYQVDQVRNLIANWTMGHNYDYLFAVDSDISFAPDTLAKLLAHDKDIVSGIYIQRIPGRHTIEIMRKNEHGGVTHVDWNTIKGQGLVPIDGCGFGCVLVKTEVLRAIPYPHFLYHSAIDHANTLSEDVHFCNQARDRGFRLWADTSIMCDHTGSWTFTVDK
jgi:glycosyltransferase involved in cell wall biosynthesis